MKKVWKAWAVVEENKIINDKDTSNGYRLEIFRTKELAIDCGYYSGEKPLKETIIPVLITEDKRRRKK